MAPARWPFIVDAVLAKLRTELGVDVFDAVPVTGDALTDFVVIGAILETDDGRSGTFTQRDHDLGPANTRYEEGRITCLVVSQSGDDDVATRRAAAFSTLADIEDVLRARITFGVDNTLWVELAAGDVLQGLTPDGAFCQINFDLTYSGLI